MQMKTSYHQLHATLCHIYKCKYICLNEILPIHAFEAFSHLYEQMRTYLQIHNWIKKTAYYFK